MQHLCELRSSLKQSSQRDRKPGTAEGRNLEMDGRLPKTEPQPLCMFGSYCSPMFFPRIFYGSEAQSNLEAKDLPLPDANLPVSYVFSVSPPRKPKGMGHWCGVSDPLIEFPAPV